MLELMDQLAAEHAELDDYFLPGEHWLDSLELMFLDRLGRREHYLGVAREDDRLVGMVTAMLQSSPVFLRRPRGLIENLIVVPDRRREGIANALVDSARAWCVKRSAAYVEVMVAVANQPGRAFWEGQGFGPMMLRLQQRVGEVNDDQR